SKKGENEMTSTPCGIKDRIALIWFSSFCWASEKRRSIPRFCASDLIESVLAVRQPLSAPTCEKPTTNFFLAASSAEAAGWVRRNTAGGACSGQWGFGIGIRIIYGG